MDLRGDTFFSLAPSLNCILKRVVFQMSDSFIVVFLGNNLNVDNKHCGTIGDGQVLRSAVAEG